MQNYKGPSFLESSKNYLELWNFSRNGLFFKQYQVLEYFSHSIFILEFWIENQVPWQKLSGKDTLYIEIDKNKPNPGDSRISGCLDSRFEKSRDAPKSVHNHSIKLDLYQMCQI